MNIGESMKEITDLSQIRESISGDLFESHNAMLMGRPLDFGRTLYVMLHRAFEHVESAKVDVFWDHFTNILTAQVVIGDYEFSGRINDAFNAREGKLTQIREFISTFKEKIAKCESLF